jgi:phosphoribosylformylglycinamidine synthase
MSVSVNILYLPGTNCQRETATAFEQVGARPRLTFLTDVLAGRCRLDDADLLCLPGGFSFGDHLGAGTVAALFLMTRVADQLAACRKRPMLCICNGFQVAVRAGLFGPAVTLTTNVQGTFRHIPDQEHIVDPDNDSFWLAGLGGQTLRFPCAHGEGRFVFAGRKGWQRAFAYPSDRNPDGSMDNVAGVTTPDGLVLGLMNHLERAPDGPLNLDVFRNGVRWVSG